MKKIVIYIVFLLYGFIPLVEAQSVFHQTDDCIKDEDCVQAPEVFKGCFHYCLADKCDKEAECPLINRYFKNFPNCAADEPCKSNPNGIMCINKKCQRK
jgi:hypothetical protein